LLKLERLTSQSDTIHTNIQKCTKIGVDAGIRLANNQGNFRLVIHRFTTSENIAQSFRGLHCLTHAVDYKVDNEKNRYLGCRRFVENTLQRSRQPRPPASLQCIRITP